MGFLTELKRRNVVRVGLAYILAAWVLLQIVDFALEVIGAPDWILQVFVLAAAVGFPVFLIFSWVFEMTPEGIKRESEIDRSQSITPHTGRKLDRVIIVFLALAVVILLADKFIQPDRGRGTVATPPSVEETVMGEEQLTPVANPSIPEPVIESDGRSVAVLPFVNMSGELEQEYFSDGISEELLNVLVRVEGLRVPSRTSSFTFRDSDKNVTEIGRELNVDHVLEGSVRKSGNRIRVTAQLIDVNTDTHLWSGTYTRELDDIFAVQDEIAQAIVGALKVTLSGDEQKSLSNHSTTNVAAYNKYLLGRHLWNQRTVQSLLGATVALREAVEIDPDYDQAWAALADAYALIPEYDAGAINEYVPLGIEAADKALNINPDSARALTARAYLKFMYEYDYQGAIEDFQRAIELDPGYATAYQWYGELLAVLRRTDEGLAQLDIAAQLDPLSVVISHVKGWLLIGAGRYDEALAQYDIALPKGPDYPSMHANLAYLNALAGNYDMARAHTKTAARLLDQDLEERLAVINAIENPELRPAVVKRVFLFNDLEGVQGKALTLMILGERELALENLEQSFEAGDPYAAHLNRMVIYDSLRDDPRFQALLAKINLWP